MKEILDDNIKTLVKQENNIDFLRYFLAFWVFLSHFKILTGTDEFVNIPSYYRLKAFFILSGFLVMNSFIRYPSIISFFDRRIKRICPAYIFIVLLCVVVGVFLSNLSILEYTTSKETYKYIFYNLLYLNFLQPTLPGVFENNPISAVNGALWTIKIEIIFYISVPILFYLLRRYNRLLILLPLIILSIFYNEIFLYLLDKTKDSSLLIMQRQFPGQMSYFYSGTLILLYFNHFQKHIKYIFPTAVLLFIFRNEFLILRWIEPITFSAIIIGFAYNFKRLNFLRKYDNISYGIYLFHFPIIQTIVSLQILKDNPYYCFLLCLILTIALSIVSFKLIEKPALKDKRNWLSFLTKKKAISN